MSLPIHPSLSHGNLTPAQESLLKADFGSLRAATGSLAAPAQLEATLMSAFKSQQARDGAARRRRDLVVQWFAPGFALAASVGMSAWMVLAPMARPAFDANAESGPRVLTDAGMFADTPFIALQSLEQIALEPRPRLIEAAIPRMWLAAYGVAVSPELAGDSLRAEMLVSANGQPLAMRFLP